MHHQYILVSFGQLIPGATDLTNERRSRHPDDESRPVVAPCTKVPDAMLTGRPVITQGGGIHSALRDRVPSSQLTRLGGPRAFHGRFTAVLFPTDRAALPPYSPGACGHFLRSCRWCTADRFHILHFSIVGV